MARNFEDFGDRVEKDPIGVWLEWKQKKAEAERARLEGQLWWRQAQQDIELARKRAEQELELGRLERLSSLSLEVLVLAARTPEQARITEGLARLNTMKGLSPETILSLAADRDPRLAQALAPVLLQIFQSGRADQYRQLMERLVAMQKEGADRTREDYQQSMRTFTQMFERFADTAVEVARAAAGSNAQVRACPDGHPVSASARFCDQCGAPLG